MDFNPIRFADYARTAASDFVEKNLPLNESIAKLAEKANLTPVQIQRVVELANLDVNDRMFKVATEKTFTFPLATLEGVQGVLHKSEPTVKTAAVFEALFPSAVAKREATTEKVASFLATVSESVPMEKRAEVALSELKGEASKRLSAAMLKTAEALRDLDKCYDGILDKAREYVLLEKNHLGDMFKFACIARPQSAGLWKGLFENVRDDLLKVAHPVDKKLIDEKLEMPGAPVEVINGRHALLIDLDTFRQKVSDTDSAFGGRVALLNDAPNPTPTGVTSFQDNQDVESYLMSEIENLAKKASTMPDKEFFQGVVKVAKAAAKLPKTNIVGRAAGRVASEVWKHPYLALGTTLGGGAALVGAGKGLHAAGKAGGDEARYTLRPPFSIENQVAGSEAYSKKM
jgi:hypothetical protein